MKIRNVAIIAHINHGKSTLADRLLEKTGTIPPLKMRAQVLDDMELERERGVTIKLKAVRMMHGNCVINLIDTPGHVDFSYEVSRSLAACEGALLVVDAVSGIQAQTVAHTLKAQALGLKIIPIVNKIDLEAAQPNEVARSLSSAFGFLPGDIIFASAKSGIGIDEVLNAIAARVPGPRGSLTDPFKALVFDSVYDEHKGVVAYVRVFEGKLARGEKIRLVNSSAQSLSADLGYFIPEMRSEPCLAVGEVGYIATGLKSSSLARVGETISSASAAVSPLPGYKEPKPVVFLSFYPVDGKKFTELKDALDRFRLTDPAVTFEREGSSLGVGFRCGFLGIFHAEIARERLRRDYGLEVFVTSPSVEYLLPEDGEQKIRILKSAQDLPQTTMGVLEPWVRMSVFAPAEYLGSLMRLCQEKRGLYAATDYVSERQVKLLYEMPLAEMIGDFFDKLKSVSSGFASLDYNLIEHRPIAVSRLDVLVAGRVVEPLSQIVIRERIEAEGREAVKKLKEVVPKQQFAVALQAAVGGKIVARETIPALRKDVTAKLYGGDRTRKDKLLEKQKEGKKRLKRFGKVDLPQEAFFALR